MGGNKITLETGRPEAAQAQGWRYGMNISGNSCANTEGPQTLWPLTWRGGTGRSLMWQSCLIPSFGRARGGWQREVSPTGTVSPDLLLKQHLHNTSLSCMCWTELKQTPEPEVSSAKSLQENKDFLSSPTLHLAAFPHSCGKDEENPPPVQNRLLGRTQLLMAFQAQLAVLRAGFNFTTNPPVSGVNPTARQERRVESQQQGCLHKLFYLQTWKLIPGDTGCFSALDLFPGLAR